jgi:zinc protease
MYKRLVETKLATSAQAGASPMHDPGYFAFSVTMAQDGDVEAVRRELAGIIKTITTETLSVEDLDRVRSEQMNGYENTMRAESAMSSLLSENVAVGDWRLAFWDRDQLPKITVQDMQRVAKAYLVDSNRTVGLFEPENAALRADIPVAPKLDALLEGYSGQAVVADGEAFDATPANIEARTKRGTAGPIKTAFLEKKTRGNRVSGTLQFRFGNETALQGKADIGSITGALLMMGTDKRTRQQISDEITRLKAQLGVSGSVNAASIDFETDRQNLPAVLRLAAEIIKSPLLPEDQLNEIKRNTVAQIESSRTDPNSIAGQAMSRYLSPYAPGDIRYVSTPDERIASINKVTVEDMRQFHKQFYGAGEAHAAFVGSFDSAEVTRLLEELFGNWKSPAAYERIKSVYKPVSGKVETFNTPDKANAIYLLGGNLPLRDDNPDYATLLIGNEILGGGFLNSRLTTRIRQKDGLSYTVSSSLNAGVFEPAGSFSVYAICAPENMARVEQGAREEIARALKDGFTASEIAEARSGILQSFKLQRGSDGALASQLRAYSYYGRDFTWMADLETKLSAVTGDQVVNALRKFIVMDSMYTGKAGDFSKVQGK